jgi:hypothetical protein
MPAANDGRTESQRAIEFFERRMSLGANKDANFQGLATTGTRLVVGASAAVLHADTVCD